MIIIGFIVLKSYGINSLYFKPFDSAINVLSPNVFFLGMLIMSSRYYSGVNYVIVNIQYMISLLCCIYFGGIYNL